MTSSPPALVVRDAHLTLDGTEILRGLTFAARPGRITALLGPNGAGKTTTIRCCTGLMSPDTGVIEVFGQPVADAIASGRIGVMPQAVGQWSGIRPLELLHHLAGLHQNPLPVAPLAERLGIHRFARTTCRRLSGGQQQVLNLAGALIGRPEMVHLDEPTTGLDPHLRRQVWALIGELRDAGVSVLLTTHAMDEAEHLADDVHIMNHGRVVRSGSVSDLTTDGDLESVFLTSTDAGGA